MQISKNDELSLDQIQALKPDKLSISPGPKTPSDSGVCIPVIQSCYQAKPILGICLGHQCLAVAFGQKIISAKRLIFGKTTAVTHTGSRLLAGLSKTFDAARYHSLVIDAAPQGFTITSLDERGDIMSMEHHSLPIFGLQFHPESFLMGSIGDQIIGNFLAL